MPEERESESKTVRKITSLHSISHDKDVDGLNSAAIVWRYAKSKGLGKLQQREVVIPKLNAVVGNPPYVRQEDIPTTGKKTKRQVKHSTKEY